MRAWKKAAALAAVVVLSAGTGVAVAEGIGGDQPASTSATPPAGGPDYLLAGGFQNEDAYVPITPCRILDTRKGFGKLQVNAPKEIDVRGDEVTFTTQGGNPGGCGIPAGATAIEATITAIDSGSGFLRAWPANIVQPNATFLNYDSAFNVSNTGTITLCGGQNSLSCNANKDLSLRAYGSATDLVVDVNGFFVRPMAASVDSAGALVEGNRVTAAGRVGGQTGRYEVIFDRNISECSFTASVSFDGGSEGYATVSPRAGKANGIFVATFNNAGSATDKPFYVEATC